MDEQTRVDPNTSLSWKDYKSEHLLPVFNYDDWDFDALKHLYCHFTTLPILAIALTPLDFDLWIQKDGFDIQMRHLRSAMSVEPVK